MRRTDDETRIMPVPLREVRIERGFWAGKARLIAEKVIPRQWLALNDRIPGAEPSHAMRNFRIAAGEMRGEHRGFCFQDSDVYKWIEAASYVLAARDREAALERSIDEAVDLIVRAQQSDGYLNTYYTITDPAGRWTNLRDCHELYCAGHLIEAAVAHHEATGKRKLLDAACRFADHIGAVFGPGEGQKRGYPGHEELELALVKLFRATGVERYLRLSRFFIDERGGRPHYFDLEQSARGDEKPYYFHEIYGHSYSQSHLPIREQTTAEGHAVRAMYLYCALADLAAECGDESLAKTSRTLWDNVVNRRMYLTGAVGSSAYGEAFTFDYDLPNDRAYAETCASIGLVFWAHRLLHLEMDGRYADAMELALYNSVLSGISLDGEAFFYVNPLEVLPEACERRHDTRHVKPARQKWFACACCPPNIARLLASLGRYIYSSSRDGQTVYIHHFISSTARIGDNGEIRISQATEYPWAGKVEIRVDPAAETVFTLALRIPGWAGEAGGLTLNGQALAVEPLHRKGYAYITRAWRPGDQIVLDLRLRARRVYAHPRAGMNAGLVALARGPVVYCLEEADNGRNLAAISLPREAEIRERYEPGLLDGVVALAAPAMRLDEAAWGDRLYGSAPGETKKIELTAVPYHAWSNRGAGEMRVWIRES